MKINKSWSILFIGLISSFPFILYNDIIYNVVGIIIFVFLLVFSVKGDVSHPYTLLFPFFLLYTISAPILVKIGILKYRETYHLSILYHYLAIVVLAITITPKRIIYNREIFIKYRNFYRYLKFKESIIIVIIPIFLVSITYILFLVKSGIHSKYERALMNNPFAFIGFSFYMLTTLVSIYILYSKLKSNTFPYKFVMFFIFFFILSFLFTGERHSLFKFIFTILIIYSFLEKKINSLFYFILVILGLFANVIAQQLKMVLLTLKFNINLNSIFIEIFHTEFKSSSRNLSILIENIPQHIDFFYGKGLMMDFIRAFIPGFLFPHTISTTTWFNEKFFPNFFQMGGGVGFSLVGVGYINFGIIGIIILFLVIGILIKKIYSNLNNPLILVIYANLLPLIVFSLRGDLSVILSQTLKHLILPIIFVIIIDKFLKDIYGRGSKYENFTN